MTEPRRYLVIVQLRADSGPDRQTRDLPLIVDWIQSFSKGEQEVAFRSHDWRTFGFFIKTTGPHFMRAEFDKCRGSINGDSMIIVEIGTFNDANLGFSRALTWLQRH